jgi:FAD/FMN-containing dehydrogenase
MLPPSLIHALDARLAGAALGPADAGWDAARAAWNLHVDQQPSLVVIPRTTLDVQAAIAFARQHGLRVAPQGTGHNAAPLGALDRSLLLKLHGLKGVEIDVAARTFRAEAGVVWQDVTSRLVGTGLVPPLGSSPDVGIMGYTLGGGFCWTGRKYGLATNNVTAIEVVLADGRAVRTTANEHPDLFWALRGGGGNFGVVTAIEMGLFEEPDIYATTLFFAPDRGADVLPEWARYIDTVADDTTSYAIYMNFPPIPEIPEPLRGNSYLVIKVLHFGPEAEGRAVAEPMRALEPLFELGGMIDVEELSHFAGDPEEPVPAIVGGHVILDELTPEAIDAVVGVGGADTPLIAFELRHIGGALGRVPEGAGARRRLPGKIVTIGIAVPMGGAGHEAAIHAHLAKMDAALAPHANGQRYINFVEEKSDMESMYEAGDLARLAAVRAVYDPSGLLQGSHEIAPAAMRRAA